MSLAKQLRAELRAFRQQVVGKTFDQAPETFKEIEGIKVRLSKIEPRPLKGVKAPQVRRHQRERRA